MWVCLSETTFVKMSSSSRKFRNIVFVVVVYLGGSLFMFCVIVFIVFGVLLVMCMCFVFICVVVNFVSSYSASIFNTSSVRISSGVVFKYFDMICDDF